MARHLARCGLFTRDARGIARLCAASSATPARCALNAICKALLLRCSQQNHSKEQKEEEWKRRRLAATLLPHLQHATTTLMPYIYFLAHSCVPFLAWPHLSTSRNSSTIGKRGAYRGGRAARARRWHLSTLYILFCASCLRTITVTCGRLSLPRLLLPHGKDVSPPSFLPWALPPLRTRSFTRWFWISRHHATMPAALSCYLHRLLSSFQVRAFICRTAPLACLPLMPRAGVSDFCVRTCYFTL